MSRASKGMSGVSAAAVSLASAVSVVEGIGSPSVVTLSAAAILAMFAERNLLYPDNRRRFAGALKSRDAFQAFILSGAGMLEHDGERRVRTRSLTACSWCTGVPVHTPPSSLAWRACLSPT